MRQSQLLGKTLRETPADAQTAAHQLLLRGGYIRQLSAGIYTYLPLMVRVLRKVAEIVRSEMDNAGCQEILMPALQPKELWVESGRWDRYTEVDGIMFAFKDRRGSMACLGPTHEEVITHIVRNEIQSYKELPRIFYQIQNKFRDEIRPRFGLVRAREFLMKDAYSFDADESGLSRSFDLMEQTYNRIFTRLGLRFCSVEADSGAIGGSGSREFMALAESGEDTILHCSECSYAANQERAESRLEQFAQEEAQRPMEEVFGEGLIGVDVLAEFLKIPVWKTTKTMLYQADEHVAAVMVRGDCEVNEVKLANALNCQRLALATAEVVEKVTGAKVGYAGPLNLPSQVTIIADHDVRGRVNFECGANRTNYHTLNVNFGRDLPEPRFADIKLAKDGNGCPRCTAGKLRAERGIELGHIFKLGTKYSLSMHAEYLDNSGNTLPMVMGCYGIGISRICAALVEQSHDEHGIRWPAQVAPFDLHLIGLNIEEESVRHECETLYGKLRDQGVQVLYDDRSSRAGEKFSDADLIGIPLRAIVSKRTIKEGKLEVKRRGAEKGEMMGVEELARLLS